jgi:hypothetical protein
MADKLEIEFEATVARVQTLEAGLRVTFDLDESSVPQAALLMDCKRRGVVLWIVATESTDNIALSSRWADK